MPKQISDESLKEILEIIANHPKGIGLKMIENEMADNIPRRTIQYRLRHLTNTGRLVAEGDRRGRIYKLVSTEANTTTKTVMKDKKVRSVWSFGGWD